MSKKPRQKSGSAGIGRWDSQLVNYNLNEDDWKAALFFVVGDRTEDFKHINILHSAIATGIRKQFYAISKDDVLNQARELGGKVRKGSNRDLPQFVEICEHVKGILDNGDEISPHLQSRLIKFKLIQIKTKDIAKREAERKVAELANRNNVRQDRVDTKGKKPISSRRSRSPAKKRDIQREVPMPLKKETKLKRRGEKEDNFQTIDDEPEYGPQAYVIIHGFSESAVLAYCAESNIPIDATIKVRSDDYETFEQLYKLAETSNVQNVTTEDHSKDDIDKQMEQKSKKFWKELDSVVLQSFASAKLHDLASFEVEIKKSLFPVDYQNIEKKNEFGLKMFDQIANICYNMLLRRREYQEYLKMINLIRIPTNNSGDLNGTQNIVNDSVTADVDMRYYNDILNSVPTESVTVPLIMYAMLEQVSIAIDESEIAASLNNTAFNYPAAPPPSTAATAVTRDENGAAEASVMDYFDNAIRGLGLSEPIVKSITDNATINDTSVWSKDNKVEIPPVVIRHGDEALKRYYHLARLNNIIPHEAELEMLRKLPVARLSQFQVPSQRCVLDRASRAHQLQHFCTKVSLTEDSLNRILKQATFENVSLTSVDDQEIVQDSKDVKPIILPWDDPYLFPTQNNDHHLDENQHDFDNWLYAEHYQADSMVQVLCEAQELRSHVDTYHNRRDNTLLVVMHNPIGKRQQHLTNWDYSLHSNVGFRNYLEYVAKDIGDIVSEKVQKEIAATEALNTAQAETVSVVVQPAMPLPPKQELISRASIKEAEIAESMESSKRARTKRSTARRSPHTEQRKTPERRTPSPQFGNSMNKKSVSKLKLQTKNEKLTEKEAQFPSHGTGSKRGASNNRRVSLPESVKSMTVDSSVRSETPVKDELNRDIDIEKTDDECEEKFLGYDLGNQMVRVSGCQATQLPCDDGLIRSERTSYVHGTLYVKTSVYKDGHHFVVHVVDPHNEEDEESNNDGNTSEHNKSHDADNPEMKDSGLMNQDKNAQDDQNQPIPPCKFGSFIAHLRDGITISYSRFGGHGSHTAAPTPTISPVKSRKHNQDKQDRQQQSQQSQSQPTPSAFDTFIHQDSRTEGELNNPTSNHSFKEQVKGLFMSCPDGLHIQATVNDKLSNEDGSSNNNLGIIVRQFYTDKSNGYHVCEALKSQITKEEIGRTFTHDGNVIKLMVDGSIQVLMPHGVICKSASGSINFPRTVTTANGQKSSDAVPNTPQKKTSSRSVSKKVSNISAVDHFNKIALEKFNQWEVISPEGQRYSTRLDSTQHQLIDEIISTVMSDPITHQRVRVREDNVIISNHDNGSSVVEYPDGTRIHTYYEERLKGRDEDGNRITERIKYRKIECNGYAGVIFNCSDGSCQILFATGTKATVQVDGNHNLNLDDGSQIELHNDGRTLYQPASVLIAGTFGKEVGVVGVYEMHHASSICCHTVDSRGNTFKVSSQGKVIVDFAKSPESDGDQLINPLILPRLFILKPDGSGAELMNIHLVDSELNNLAMDKDNIIMNENISNRSKASCVTILQPLANVTLNRWTAPPQARESIMASLRVNSFRVDSTIADIKQEMRQAIFGQENDKKKAALHKKKIHPNGVEIRHLIRYPRISKKEKKTLFNCLSEYNEFVNEREINADQLLPQDERNLEERSQASDFTVNYRSQSRYHTQQEELNEFISDIIANSSKPELSDRDIIQLYLHAKSPSKLEKQQKPKPKRTPADWQADREELAAAEARKEQLKSHHIPPYFHTEKGKEILEYINEPNMTALTKELAKSPLKSHQGDRSSTALSYILDNLKLDSEQTLPNPSGIAGGDDTGVVDLNVTSENNPDNKDEESNTKVISSLDVSYEEARPIAPTPGKAVKMHTSSKFNEVEHHSTTMSPSRPANATPSQASVYPSTVAKFAEQDDAKSINNSLRGDVQSAPLERITAATELETASPDILTMHNGNEFKMRNLVSESDAQRNISTNESLSRSSQSRVRKPVSVKGSRPGSIPNEKYMKIESPVRRDVNTASVSNGRQSRAFEVYPDCVEFGVLKEGYMYRSTFLLKNIGVDVGRYKITQPPPSTGLKASFQPGPLAVGMTAKIIVDIYAVAVGIEGGKDGAGSARLTSTKTWYPN
ncbi:uncharacterized protein TRIADDRAFT_56694 [Trichoplax adhaerens]|uniref:Sperm-associated antigen 17 n=1 Tax=Trichoplax adhaerens TaxID=10228 RepID=B3RWC0_TRIAD|nr:hypothetical protein TRIADDRAFT_56694 [Trichoplax adhaerens]EDV25105.1 hypothetical protein TRIADDRAFT_56694 [Trichoplax adhaerens]|eukprot:XP_002112995.1 hypothetical protein TRIADDRAFT_56694 [Trichoplax adhaerens]